MSNIIILIVVAIVVVIVKEVITRRLFKQSQTLIKNQSLSDERLKKQSRNLTIQLFLKCAWAHFVFFIASLLGGLHTTMSVGLGFIYIVLIVFISTWSIIQHKKYYRAFGNVEGYLATHETRDLQAILKTNNRNQQRIIEYYQVFENRIGVPNTIVLAIAIIISIVMWIGTF